MSAKKPALGFIFITLLIDVTGWGIIIPVVPGLIIRTAVDEQLALFLVHRP